MCWWHSGDGRTVRRVGRNVTHQLWRGRSYGQSTTSWWRGGRRLYIVMNICIWMPASLNIQQAAWKIWGEDGDDVPFSIIPCTTSLPWRTAAWATHDDSCSAPTTDAKWGTLYRMLCQRMTIRVSGHLIFSDCTTNQQQQVWFLQRCSKDLKMLPLLQEIYVVWYNIINWYVWLNSY